MGGENRLDLAVTVHFTVPDGMNAVDAHALMLQRFRGWLSSPDNELRTSWGLFSPNCEPDIEPCIAVMSGKATTNLFPHDPGQEGRGADARTGISQREFTVWCDLSPSGSIPAPHLASRLELDLEDVQAALRGLEARGLATRDAEGTWWRTYL